MYETERETERLRDRQKVSFKFDRWMASFSHITVLVCKDIWVS